MWNAHNTVFGSKRSFLSIKWFAHLYMSIFCHDGHVTWLNSRSLLPVSALFAVCHQLVSDVIENLGEEVSCTDRTGHGNDLELTPMIKMKTRYHLVMNFCRSITIAELWRPDAARHWQILLTQKHWKVSIFLRFFLEKWPIMEKFAKFCSKRIHCNTDPHVVCKFREI